jgi:hypothetical protein
VEGRENKFKLSDLLKVSQEIENSLRNSNRSLNKIKDQENGKALKQIGVVSGRDYK